MTSAPDASVCDRCGRYVKLQPRGDDSLCTLCHICSPLGRRNQLQRLFRITAQRNADGQVVYVRE